MQKIIKILRGSHAYGTAGPDSDIDYLEILIPDIDHVLGLERFRGQQVLDGDLDVTRTTLYEFVKSCLQGKSALIECLFPEEDCIVEIDDIGRRLWENRHGLLSQRLYKPFVGFGCGQLRRTLNGNKCRHVAEIGYDPKSAYHCLRVLSMAYAFKQTGVLRAFIHDDQLREKCLEIKAGKWNVERVETTLRQLIEDFDALESHPSIPSKPDYHFWNKFIIDSYCESLNLRREK